MVHPKWRTVDDIVEAFREHLVRTRGVCSETQRQYARPVRSFLNGVFVDGAVDVAVVEVGDVVRFVTELAARGQPRNTANAVSALRAFFRFLRIHGLREDRLEEAVPGVRKHRLAGLPRHMSAEDLERLVESLDCSTPRARRDRAIVLCVARLGLRANEVARILLDDIDWRAAVLRVPSRKTGRGARLPIPADAGDAIVAYLYDGRPASPSRHVFVLHRSGRVGDPATQRTVYDAVKVALDKAGIDAPVCGPNLLRHSLATRLVRSGASLKEIADLMGHRCLETTQVYAKLDLAGLRLVAQPWPEVVS